MNAADVEIVITAVTRHLSTDYVDHEVGMKAATELQIAMEAGEFDHLQDGSVFAKSISQRLQSLTGDGHLNVEFSKQPIRSENSDADTFDSGEMERHYGRHRNFGVQNAGRLEGNIGYLDLRVFSPIDMGAETVAAAMNVIANTDALIIDLRKNGGGIGDMADFVASYLFDHNPRPLTGTYDRPTNTLTQRFTHAHVPGRRFGLEKPVYVLISDRTFSAAEALAYNLQALERATIVGEASGGGAHPFEYLPVHEHFVLWSVTAKSVNPITGGNWQGVGVQPDISVAAENALETALKELQLGASD